MTIVVTGATGPFGRHAVESLLQRGVPAAEILATGRQIDKIQDLGVRTQRADYGNPDELRAAFDGADQILFTSGSEVGARISQHRNVVDAAKAAGVRLIAYTSIAHADTTDLILAGDPQATERMILDSGLPYLFLRNSWYLENYNYPSAVEHGLFGAAGQAGSAPRPAPTTPRRPPVRCCPARRTGRTSWAGRASRSPSWPPRSARWPVGRSPTPT